MRKWYVHTEESLIGPVDEKQIAILFKNGRLRNYSWVCEVDSTDWLPAQEIEELASLFRMRQMDLIADGDVDDSWVVLKQIEDEAGQKLFEQSGPFKAREVLTKISVGELEYSDRVWRSGFSTWKNIGELETFVPKSFEEVVKPEDLSEIEFIDPELEVKKAEIKKEKNYFTVEEKPVDAGSDLLKNSYEFRIQQEEIESKEEKDLEEYVSFRARRNFSPRKRRFLQQKFSWKFYGTVGFIVLFVSALLIRNILLKQQQQSQIEAIAKKQIKEQWQQAPQLKMTFMQQDNGGILKFATNHRSSDQLKITIIGKKGQILEQESLQQKKLYDLQVGKELVIDTANWKLPRGYYEISAKYSDIAVNKQVFVGKKDSNFYQELQRHQRVLGQQKEKEGMQLRMAAEKLRRQAERLESGFKNSRRNPLAWSRFYKRWRKNQSRLQKSQNILQKETDKIASFKDEVLEIQGRNQEIWKTAKEMNSHIINPRKPAPTMSKLRKIASDLRRVESAKLQ